MRDRLGLSFVLRTAPLWLPVFVVACSPPPGDGLRGTTRVCAEPKGTTLPDACFQQCANPEAPDCKVTRKDATPVVLSECRRDPATGMYAITDGAFGVPEGDDECFVIDGNVTGAHETVQPACMGSNVQIVIVRADGAQVPEGSCYDIDCATASEPELDCPDLGDA